MRLKVRAVPNHCGPCDLAGPAVRAVPLRSDRGAAPGRTLQRRRLLRPSCQRAAEAASWSPALEIRPCRFHTRRDIRRRRPSRRCGRPLHACTGRRSRTACPAGRQDERRQERAALGTGGLHSPAIFRHRRSCRAWPRRGGCGCAPAAAACAVIDAFRDLGGEAARQQCRCDRTRSPLPPKPPSATLRARMPWNHRRPCAVPSPQNSGGKTGDGRSPPAATGRVRAGRRLRRPREHAGACRSGAGSHRYPLPAISSCSLFHSPAPRRSAPLRPRRTLSWAGARACAAARRRRPLPAPMPP